MRHVAAGSPLTEVGRGRTDLASLASEDPGSGSVLQVEVLCLCPPHTDASLPSFFQFTEAAGGRQLREDPASSL